MKIMLTAVGNRDPYAIDARTHSKSPGPLLAAARQLTPDIIIMFPTQRQLDDKLSYTEDRCDEIEKEIKKLMPSTALRRMPLNLPDPTDYHAILLQLSSMINEIKEKYKQSQVEYLLNISSATPQIQASFLIMVSSQRLPARVYQARDPHYLQAGEQQVREIDIQFIEEENQINRARIFYDKFYFSSGSDELIQLAMSTGKAERIKMAELYSSLLEAYHYMDLYQHEKALQRMEELIPLLQRFRKHSLITLLVKQLECLQSIVKLGDKEGYENLCDLYHNTQRRFVMEQYVDCLNRFKRIYEGGYFYVARQELGISRPESKLEEQRNLDWVKKIVGHSQGMLYTWGIAQVYEQKKGRKIISENLENQISGLSKQRNYTINNHGMRSVEKEDARKAVKVLAEFLQQIFPGRDLDEHPFSAPNLSAVGKIIFQDI